MRLSFLTTVKENAKTILKPNSLLIDYHLAKQFDYSEDWGCVSKVKEFPLFLRDYCRVAEKLSISGYYPIVHGQQSSWMISQIILKALGYEGLETLRSINTMRTQSNSDVGLEISKEIEAIRQQKITCARCSQMRSWGKMAIVEAAFFDSLRKNIPVIHDHHDHIRNQVISATIGLFHTQVNESPLYLTFGSHAHKAASGFFTPSQDGNQSMLPIYKCKTISNMIIRESMLRSNYSEEHITKLIQAINPLYEAANTLDIGHIIVIGIPKEIGNEDHYLYHSRRYGIPTGESIPEILKALTFGKIPPIDLQVRLLLQKERNYDISQLPVINIMNLNEVNDYCNQQTLITRDIDLVLQSIYSADHREKVNISSIIHNASPSTVVEEANRKQYNELRNSVECVVKQFISPIEGSLKMSRNR